MLNVRPPLTPFTALTVFTTMDPLVLAAPDPAIIEIAPPVAPAPLPAVKVSDPPWPVVAASVELPDTMLRAPPAFLLPLPTVILTTPPLPVVACPEPISTAPELPLLVVPDENVSTPLTPFDPAFNDLIEIEPLVLNRPYPDCITTLPPVPVVDVLSPAVMTISPPLFVSPLPTVRLMDPP